MNTPNKNFLRFLIVFFAVFLFLYYGILFLTGLAVPGGNYKFFIDTYVDVAEWMRNAILYGTKIIVHLFGYETVRTDTYILRIVHANGIKLVYSCLGFAVMSFWVAYIIATRAKFLKKVIWLFGGLLLIYFVNVIRVAMVLIAGNKGWQFPFGWDHHTWFNIITYIIIFTMMYLFEKQINAGKNNG